MRTVDYRGTLTALSAISHGGTESGTTQTFRRETFIKPDGTVLHSVPVVSGGVVRGSIRRTAARMMQHAITPDGRLPFPVVHAFRTGGALRETRSSGEVLTGERQARMRDLVPLFGVFGVAAGGRIMSGRLLVDKPMPIAAETMHLAAHYDVDLTDYAPPTMWEVVQRETYTRLADVNAASAQPYIDAEGTRELPKGGGDMVWTHETLLPGTRLFHSLVLEDATALEVAFFDDVVAAWSRSARIGGQIARGLGRVRPDYTRTVRDVTGREADPEAAPDWVKHVRANADDVREVLRWL